MGKGSKKITKSNQTKTNRILVRCGLFLFLILIITQPICALSGAKIGLLLWFNTVLPTLLPFIILSNFIIRFQVTDYICKIFSPVFKRIFRISDIGCYPIIIGILSGYPMGAKTCSDLIKEGLLDREEGQYIMILVGNASFIFLTSFLSVSSLAIPERKYQLLALIYLSSIISATLYRIISHNRSKKTKNISDENVSITEYIEQTPLSMTTVDHCILDGFTTITKVGGYIIMFSVLTQILSGILTSFGIAKFLLLGSLEITTGIYLVSSSVIELAKKIVLTITITSFGGFSSLAQVGSVIENSGLSLKTYLHYKLINSFVAFLLSIVYVILFNII
jgi:sporulation integral membrane protein YlbJ